MNRGILLLLAVCTLAACTSYDDRDYRGLSTTPADARLGEIVALWTKCPSITPSDEKALAPALLGVFSSIGAQFAVGAIEGAITDYKEGLSGFFMASAPSSKESFGNAGCVIIARGLIGNPDRGVAQTDGQLDMDLLAKLGLSDYPAFYLELAKESVGSSIFLAPVYLSYATSSARSKGSGKKYVSAAIAFSSQALEKNEDPSAIVTKDNAYAIAFHDFGRLEIGKHYLPPTLRGTKSIVQIDTSAEKAIQEFSITAVIAESEEAGVALKAIQSAFNANKDALKTELEKIIKSVGGSEKTQ